MTSEEKVAYIRAQVLCAELRMQGMIAENIDASRACAIRPYNLRNFEQVAKDFGITHNQVMAFFIE